ncbi:MAG: DUF2162 domain-containing protein [Candidatus Brocadiia bacterium]
MDLSLSLWTGGMLFTLGIFATKVGLGLGFGGVRWRGTLLTHTVYIALFLIAALLSKPLTAALRPILQAGPYLHAMVALIMIGWGIHLFRGQHRIRDNSASSHSLLLLIPCPVCFSAVVLSTWTALEITGLPPLAVGVGLGLAFVLLSSVLHLSVKLRGNFERTRSSSVALALTMMAIGAYFLASLILPAKIEQARSAYRTFTANNARISSSGGTGVVFLLFAVLLAGYLTRKKSEPTHE